MKGRNTIPPPFIYLKTIYLKTEIQCTKVRWPGWPWNSFPRTSPLTKKLYVCGCCTLFFPFWGGVEPSSLLLRPLLMYCTSPDYYGCRWEWSNRWNDWQEKPKYSEKTSPSASFSTTNPTWPDPGSNPGRRSGKPAGNRLNYGTAVHQR
jgi:hypothetical protein